MATKSLEKIIEKAERLNGLRRTLEVKKEAFDNSIISEEEEMERLKKELVDDLNLVGLASIKTKSGDTYTKAVKKGISITNEIFAYRWAEENKATKIDLILASQIIKEMVKAPPGFEKVETEYIKVTKPKDETNNKI